MRDGPAHFGRRRIDREIEAARELQAAQNAQRVFRKRFAGGAEHAVIEVFTAAEEVEQLAGQRIESQRVNREIAAARGFARCNVRVEGGEEVAMSESDLVIAAWNAEVAGLAVRGGE